MKYRNIWDNTTSGTEKWVRVEWATCERCGEEYRTDDAAQPHICNLNDISAHYSSMILDELVKIENLLAFISGQLEALQ